MRSKGIIGTKKKMEITAKEFEVLLKKQGVNCDCKNDWIDSDFSTVFNVVESLVKKSNDIPHKVDLRECKKGDILISSQGTILEYVGPTPAMGVSYLDHVVRYVPDERGVIKSNTCFGSRTHDGFVYKHKRNPEFDHDIVKVLPKKQKD